jgi:3-phosphoglycerate kinase
LSNLDNLGNVLIRSDLNVPNKNGKITDNFRILKSIEIIKYILDKSRTITFASHMGRPEGKDLNFSLRPVAESMTNILGKEVRFIEEVYGEKVHEQIKKSESKIFLLENLRFEEGEIANDEHFSEQTTKPFNSYIFDAFGAAHREHASVVSFGENIESFQGPLMDKEIYELDKLLNNSESGYAVLLGGAKISDKLNLIEKLLPKVEYLMVGGGMCFTFLKALGHEIGRSLLEESFILKAKELINSEFGKKIILPIDFGVSNSIDSSVRENVNLEDFKNNHVGVDIGPQSVFNFKKILDKSNNIFWNGPMGIFEKEEFSYGTREITEIISNSSAYTCIGGGDSVRAINKFSDKKYFNHISTGGGASLEYLEGKKLPGVNKYKSLII